MQGVLDVLKVGAAPEIARIRQIARPLEAFTTTARTFGGDALRAPEVFSRFRKQLSDELRAKDEAEANITGAIRRGLIEADPEAFERQSQAIIKEGFKLIKEVPAEVTAAIVDFMTKSPETLKPVVKILLEQLMPDFVEKIFGTGN